MKNRIFKEGSQKKIHRVELPEKGGGAWTVCRFKGRGGGWQKEGVVFLKGRWYPNVLCIIASCANVSATRVSFCL